MSVPQPKQKWIKYAFTIHLSTHCLWDPAEETNEEYRESLFKSIQNSISQWPIKFAFFGREQCETTGAWHAQGYLEFQSRTALSVVKSYEDKEFVGHWESAKATYQLNWDYCTKVDKNPLICGTLPKSAVKEGGTQEKKRWKDTLEAAKEARWNDVPADLMIRYVGNLHKIAAMHCKQPEPLEDYHAEWIYGEPGSGKSSYAWKQYPEMFPKPANKWWCGYGRQEVVIIEDIDKDSIERENLTQLLKAFWLDKIAFIAETKGSSLGFIRPKKIIITSNYRVEECFKNPKDAVAVARRCVIRNFRGYIDSNTKEGKVEEYDKDGNFVREIYDHEKGGSQIATTTPEGDQTSFNSETTQNSETPNNWESDDESSWLGRQRLPMVNGPSEEWKYTQDSEPNDGISLGTQDTIDLSQDDDDEEN